MTNDEFSVSRLHNKNAIAEAFGKLVIKAGLSISGLLVKNAGNNDG